MIDRFSVASNVDVGSSILRGGERTMPRRKRAGPLPTPVPDPMSDRSLVGVHNEVDQFVDDLAFFGEHLAAQGFLPGNGGDISCLLSLEAGAALLDRYGSSAQFFRFDDLTRLASIRADGRNYYNAESIREDLIRDHVEALAGRVLIVTATGAKLWDVARSPGRRVCVLQVSRDISGIHLLFGNAEYGTIPSIETPTHLVANAINLRQGLPTSAVLHCHPPAIVALCTSDRVKGNYEALNRALYRRKEGLLTNLSELIGVIPYHPSGSAVLLEASLASFYEHRASLWQLHGLVVRERSLERCVDLLEYAEDAAKAALAALNGRLAFEEMALEDVRRAIDLYHLRPDVLSLFGSTE